VAAKKQEWRRSSNTKRRSAFAKGKRRKSGYVRMPRGTLKEGGRGTFAEGGH